MSMFSKRKNISYLIPEYFNNKYTYLNVHFPKAIVTKYF